MCEVPEETQPLLYYSGCILFILGLILYLYEMITKIPREKSSDDGISKDKQIVVIISLFIIGVLFVIGVLLIVPGFSHTPVPINNTTVTPVVTPTEVTTPTPTETPIPEIKITYPSNSVPIHFKENLIGTANNIPEGQEIWILVYPHSTNNNYTNYYPIGNTSVQPSGEWSLLNKTIGPKEDGGNKFDIIAVLADKKAQEEFNNYIATNKKTLEWKGMEQIPEGAKVCNKTTITRVQFEE